MPFPYEGDRFPPALGAVVQNTILIGEQPAREVVHTPEGDWCVGDGINDPNVFYTCYVVDGDSRARLLDLIPPKYADVIAHHITVRFGVSSDAAPPDMPSSVCVTGVADDGRAIQGLRVAIDGSTVRDDGRIYHITWSIDRSQGARPVDTNRVMPTAQDLPPINIAVTPTVLRAEAAGPSTTN